MTTPLLELDDLSVRYGGVTALRHLNLTVQQGELVTLLGSNGAGKSTTLRAISQLVPAAARRRGLARQTVADNLELGAWLRRDRQGIRRDLDRCYGLFPRLAERRTQAAGSLSGGEQQMLAIARALMAQPTLLMLDEPSLGLAPKLVGEVMAALAQLHQEGLTILLVEQNAQAALEIADRGYVLDAGTLTLEGTAAELLGNPALREAYLGSG